MHRKMLYLLALILVVSAAGAYAGDTSTATVTITVTPVAGATISISPNSYAFGLLDLNTSSNSAEGAICPVITNSGDVGVDLEKTVHTDDDWTLAIDTDSVNEFMLWAVTSQDNQARPGLAEFGDYAAYGAAHSSFSPTLDTFNLLKDTNGTQQSLIVGQTAALWFRINMPGKLNGTAANEPQSMQVYIRGMAQ